MPHGDVEALYRIGGLLGPSGMFNFRFGHDVWQMYKKSPKRWMLLYSGPCKWENWIRWNSVYLDKSNHPTDLIKNLLIHFVQPKMGAASRIIANEG